MFIVFLLFVLRHDILRIERDLITYQMNDIELVNYQ
jgi:hypothetical protein